jgi:hypothetical protein
MQKSQSKIDQLGLSEKVINWHREGYSHFDISAMIKQESNESLHSQTIYKWLRMNIPDYLSPKYQSQGDRAKEKIVKYENVDLTIADKPMTSKELAKFSHDQLTKTFIKLNIIINSKLDTYDTTGIVPTSEIKTLKMVVEIMSLMTNRGMDQNSIMSIESSLDNDVS